MSGGMREYPRGAGIRDEEDRSSAVEEGYTEEREESCLNGSVSEHDHMRQVRGGVVLDGLRAIKWSSKT